MKFPTSLNDFVKTFENEHPDRLRLKYAGKKADFDISSAIDQIECRRKCRYKLPTLLRNREFVFPSVLSSEQASSEATARFHTSLLEGNPRVFDLTCGLGVDDYFMSFKASDITTCDINPRYADAAANNFRILGRENIRVINSDSIEWLTKHADARFDLIMADPARRDGTGKRVFGLSDCSPDIAAVLPILRNHSPRLLLKVSPMMDITALCRELGNVTRLYVIAVDGECKELFADCDLLNLKVVDPLVSVHNLTGADTDFAPSLTFRLGGLSEARFDRFVEDISDITDRFLYEPDAAVMKSGAADLLMCRYGNMKKLHPNTMLFVSDNEHMEFPGRILRVRDVVLPRNAKALLGGKKRNIICRNFPMKPDEIAGKYRLIQGSQNEFLVCGSWGDKRSVLLDCVLIKR